MCTYLMVDRLRGVMSPSHLAITLFITREKQCGIVCCQRLHCEESSVKAIGMSFVWHCFFLLSCLPSFFGWMVNDLASWPCHELLVVCLHYEESTLMFGIYHQHLRCHFGFGEGFFNDFVIVVFLSCPFFLAQSSRDMWDNLLWGLVADRVG